VIGRTRRPFDAADIRDLLNWVDNGGRLVLIDRELEEEFAKAIAVWQFTYKTNDLELLFGSDPSDQHQMTGDMPASRPVQPTVLTSRVNAVQTSKFASHIEILPKAAVEAAPVGGDGSYQVMAQGQPTPIDFYQASPSPTVEVHSGADYDAPPPPPPARAAPVTEVRGDELAGDKGFTGGLPSGRCLSSSPLHSGPRA
jgi:hypothetical protein